MNVAKPTISVIVPVYNVEPYLRQCIDSILAQTYSNFELILVDDGSPDNCGAICDEYAAKDSRIVVIHQENRGLSAARNAGLDIMHGEYVTFVDSDDLLHYQALEILHRYLNLYDADICKGIGRMFEVDSEVCMTDISDPEIRCLTRHEACRELCESMNWMVIVCCKLYKSCIFDNIRFPVGKKHEDEAVMHRVLYLAEKVVSVWERLYYYRQNPTSIMHTYSLTHYDDNVSAFTDRYLFFLQNNELEFAEMAKKTADNLTAKYSIQARIDGVYPNVCNKYRMPLWKALRRIKMNCSQENYEWWLGKCNPLLLKLYVYHKKINSLFRK